MKFSSKRNTSRYLLKLFTILLSTSFLFSDAQAMWSDDDSYESLGGSRQPVYSGDEEDSSEDLQTEYRMGSRSSMGPPRSPSRGANLSSDQRKPVFIPTAMPNFPHKYPVGSSPRSGARLIAIDDTELPPSQPSGKQLVHIEPIYGDPKYGDFFVMQNRIIGKYSQKPLIQYDTKGDGHCLTYSIRIPRNELVDRISQALKQGASIAEEIEMALFAAEGFHSYCKQHLSRSAMVEWLGSHKNSTKWFDAKFALAAAILEGTNVYIWENVDGFNRLIDFYEQKDTSREFPTKHLAYVQRCHYEIMASPMDPDFESQVAFGELHSGRQHLPPLDKGLYPTSEEIAMQVRKNRKQGKLDRIKSYLGVSTLQASAAPSSSSIIMVEIDPKTRKPLPSSPISPSSSSLKDIDPWASIPFCPPPTLPSASPDPAQRRGTKDRQTNNPSASFSSAPTTYEDYFKEFLPKMGDSCRAFNGFEKTDEEILFILFPDLPQGTYPDRERATQKFAELAEGGRPYAKLFNPPSFSSSAPMTYEEYFREFLPKMGDACRAFNGFKKTDEEILAILFSGLPQGAYPDRETATKKFAELAEAGRSYAKLFNPPSK